MAIFTKEREEEEEQEKEKSQRIKKILRERGIILSFKYFFSW